jgi:hypothetical protein
MALPREHLLDELATAYVQVVAAMAGATIAKGRDYGVDGTLKQVKHVDDGIYAETGYPIDFQVKGTSVADLSGPTVAFDLNARNYNLIVGRSPSATPFYFFLVCFGMAGGDPWVAEEGSRLVLGATAFWWTASGSPTPNARTQRIQISATDRLTSAAIRDMLDGSRMRFFV